MSREGIVAGSGPVAALLLCIAMMLVGARVQAETAGEPVYDIDIPASNAAEGLNRLAEQTGAIMLFPYELAEDRQANAVTGRYTLLDALDALLRGTDLSGGLSERRVISISVDEKTGDAAEEREMQVDNRSFGRRVVAALATAFVGGGVMAQDEGGVAAGSDNAGKVEEIVVTAAKREQNLRDVAGSVSAMSGEQLSRMGAESLSDYVMSMPGVAFNDYQPGVSEVVIRGVSSTTYHEQGQTVTGYYINEIPLSEPGWPIVIPDIDTFDLKRVEVLRGPQGTLFGSASLGGLVNYIANEADPTGFDSAAELGFGQTENSDDANYAVKGMVNVPLIDNELAIRAVALQRYDAGFLDNVTTGVDDANDLKTRGGRFSAVYLPTDTTRLSWMSMYQESELGDQTYTEVGTFTRDTSVPEPHNPELTLHSLRFEQDFDLGTLTLLGSLADKESRIVFDATNTGYLQGTPAWTNGTAEADIRNVEVRFSSRDDAPLRWIVGAMHQKSEKSSADDVTQPGAEAFVDANPDDFGGHPGSLLAPDDVLSSYQVDQENEETALFGELSYGFTDELTLTVGGRYFDASTVSTVTRPPSATFVGVFDPDGSQFTEGADDDGFTPKVSLAWEPNDRIMAYASYSEGFRVGGANPNPPGATAEGAEPSYSSDSVNNYELGVRTTWADSALLLDATAFHIDWEDIQVRLFTPAPLFLAYVTNAGSAEIDGVEFSGRWQVTDRFDLSSNVTYLDARLAEFLPDTFAPGGGHPPGSTLPGASDWVVNTAASFTLGGEWQPRFLLSHQYISEAPVAFSSPTNRGGFSLVDVRVSMNPMENVTVSLSASNALDEYGVLNAPFADFFPQPLGSVTRPRTIGMTVNWYVD